MKRTVSLPVTDGQLLLRLLPAPAGTVDSTNAPKAFLGAEVRSKMTLTYGRVKAPIFGLDERAAVAELTQRVRFFRGD